ncbi:MAG TPA: hypothetical protein VM388_01130 [Acidimicrobiales bacterium]|nr:hypothetical protein [Acidimicrobiales bacterium]
MTNVLRRMLFIAAAMTVLSAGTAGALMREPTEPIDTSGSGGGVTYQATPDFNGDKTADSCAVSDSDRTASCTIKTQTITGTSTSPNVTYRTSLDPGWMAGRAWVDHNGDGKADYCRVVDYTRLACTVSIAPATTPASSLGSGFGEGFGDTFYSQNLDAGWDDTRTWKDVNGDGKMDYCRITGNFIAGYQAQCTISNGQGFGGTVITLF